MNLQGGGGLGGVFKGAQASMRIFRFGLSEPSWVGDLGT